eukprot:2677644-Rhodomonas_salina.6
MAIDMPLRCQERKWHICELQKNPAMLPQARGCDRTRPRPGGRARIQHQEICMFVSICISYSPKGGKIRSSNPDHHVSRSSSGSKLGRRDSE